MKKYDVVAFESKERKGFFTADGPELAFLEGDENGEVSRLEHALLLICNDLQRPTEQDLEKYYTFMKKLKIFDFNAFRKEYEPKYVQINQKQLNEIRERNDW